MKNIVNLGNVATYINGYAFKPSDWAEDGTPIIRIQDLTGNSYQMNRFKGIVDSKYDVNSGDVLISWSASLGVYVWNRGNAVLNQHIFKVVFDKEEVDKDFFVFQIDNLLKRAANQAHGATMRHLTKPVFDALPFYLPDIKTQRLISSKLNLIVHLIEDHHEQLKKLDELIRSRFIEMFGDPQSNCYNWKIVPLKDVMVGGALNGYFTKPQNYDIEGNVGVICVSDVVNRKYTNVNALRRAFASEKDLQKYCVKYGDMLFCRSSLVKEGIGKASIIPPHTENDILFECHVIKITLDMSRVIPEYLQALSITDFFRIQVIRQSKTATMTTIGQKDIASVNILLPPMELQKRFTEFSAQIDKSKYREAIFLYLLEDIRICCNI